MEPDSFASLVQLILKAVKPSTLAVLTISILWKKLIEEEERFSPSLKKRKDPRMSMWWTEFWIDEAGLYTSGTAYQLKRFRHRFRLSKPALVKLVALVREWLPFVGEPDCTRRSGAPIELLVMGSLAILGRVVTFEILEDVTFIFISPKSLVKNKIYTEFLEDFY